MSLILGVPLDDCILIGGERFCVTKIMNPQECIVEDGEGIRYTLTDDRAEEIRPDVFVSVGLNQTMTTAKLSFDAPRSVEIRREVLTDVKSS